jgi:MYXO-CTERM domain-containing protein
MQIDAAPNPGSTSHVLALALLALVALIRAVMRGLHT